MALGFDRIRQAWTWITSGGNVIQAVEVLDADGNPAFTSTKSLGAVGVNSGMQGGTTNSSPGSFGTGPAIAANASRRGGTIQNVSASAILYVYFGATAPMNGVFTACFALQPGDSISMSIGGYVLTDAVYAASNSASCPFVYNVF